MKLRLTLLLAILLFLVACSKKEETPATSVQPNSPQPTAPAPDQNAANQPAAAPAAAPAEAPAAAPTQQAAAPAAVAETPKAAPAPPPKPKPVVIPSGTALTVRTTSPLSSDKSQTGDSFHATLAEPIEVDGKVAVPEGADLIGTVVDAQKKGKIKGEARLQLALTSMSVKGVKYPIETSMTGQTAKGKGKRTAATTAGGAGLGAIIGGIAGGGKGAGIGALVGGGAGFVGGAFTGNKQIELPAESALVFKLNSSVTLKSER